VRAAADGGETTILPSGAYVTGLRYDLQTRIIPPTYRTYSMVNLQNDTPLGCMYAIIIGSVEMSSYRAPSYVGRSLNQNPQEQASGTYRFSTPYTSNGRQPEFVTKRFAGIGEKR